MQFRLRHLFYLTAIVAWIACVGTRAPEAGLVLLLLLLIVSVQFLFGAVCTLLTIGIVNAILFCVRRLRAIDEFRRCSRASSPN
jgi:hypothetical protein